MRLCLLESEAKWMWSDVEWRSAVVSLPHLALYIVTTRRISLIYRLQMKFSFPSSSNLEVVLSLFFQPMQAKLAASSRYFSSLNYDS